MSLTDSIFEYPDEASDARSSVSKRKPQKRSLNWKFRDVWRISSTTIHSDTTALRKEQARTEIERRIRNFMERADLMKKIRFMSILMDCTPLLEHSEIYDIPLRCYVQGTVEISKSALQAVFLREADWEPVVGGLFADKEFHDDHTVAQVSWERYVIHGELHLSNANKKHVSQ